MSYQFAGINERAPIVIHFRYPGGNPKGFHERIHLKTSTVIFDMEFFINSRYALSHSKNPEVHAIIQFLTRGYSFTPNGSSAPFQAKCPTNNCNQYNGCQTHVQI